MPGGGSGATLPLVETLNRFERLEPDEWLTFKPRPGYSLNSVVGSLRSSSRIQMFR